MLKYLKQYLILVVKQNRIELKIKYQTENKLNRKLVLNTPVKWYNLVCTDTFGVQLHNVIYEMSSMKCYLPQGNQGGE